jgi:hypothetical protein
MEKMEKREENEECNFTVQDWIDELSKHNRDAIFMIDNYPVRTSRIQSKTIEWVEKHGERHCTWSKEAVNNVVAVVDWSKSEQSGFIHKSEPVYYGELLQRAKQQLLNDQITEEKEIFDVILKRLKGCPHKIYFFSDTKYILDGNDVMNNKLLESLGVDKLFTQHEDSFIWISKVPYLEFTKFSEDPIQHFIDTLGKQNEPTANSYENFMRKLHTKIPRA